jgi:hypothetical protein
MPCHSGNDVSPVPFWLNPLRFVSGELAAWLGTYTGAMREILMMRISRCTREVLLMQQFFLYC